MHVVVAAAGCRTCRGSPANSVADVVGVDVGERALHALGLAGGARRVVHGAPAVRSSGSVVGLAGRRARRRAGSPAIVADREAARRPGSRSRRRPPRATSAKRSWATNALASQSLDDVRDLGADEVVVDRHEVEAGLQRGEVQLEHLDAVRAAAWRRRRPARGRAPAGRARAGWHAASSSPAVSSAPSGSTSARWSGFALRDGQKPRSAMASK